MRQFDPVEPGAGEPVEGAEGAEAVVDDDVLGTPCQCCLLSSLDD